jgi:HEAT repeat protein
MARKGARAERSTAIRALGELGNSEYRPTLETLAGDEYVEGDLRREAVEALELLDRGADER